MNALARETSGTEGPWVTLVHGGLVASETWRHVAAALSRDRRVVTCDLRGYGASMALASPRVSDHAHDLIELWDDRGIDRGVVVGF